MENLLFIRIEIFIFIISISYILYYLGIKIYLIYFKVKKIVKPEKIESKKSALNKVCLGNQTKNNSSKNKNHTKITDINKQKIIDILKRVRVNSTKGYFDTARNLIVEGLSFDKYNRELNIELALIYEKEKNYLNAEYIYKDLLEFLKVDFEIMKKLGYIYAMQNKLKESLDIYEQIHNKKMDDDSVIDMLSELSFGLKKHKKALKYINLYLVGKPRDVDKLFMKAKCLDKIGNQENAVPVYKRILDLQPYNTKAKTNLIQLEEKLEIALK